jgi:hypothetical protein
LPSAFSDLLKEHAPELVAFIGSEPAEEINQLLDRILPAGWEVSTMRKIS